MSSRAVEDGWWLGGLGWDRGQNRPMFIVNPFIADYPEQVMLAGIVQNWCAKCTALSNDLDGDIAGRRTHSLTDELLAAFDGDILWDEYGIDEDIVGPYKECSTILVL
ncbi:hypothetical protein B0H10DRAFT_1956348 [Mycena sp. CBHHK59/15]|nr:hypothetical protein B0H10DRAFT_1962729 [Mycena sp. CBHHK59/15]KAJ6607334.1 hypothetical protein B0H10DRAFT_1956348 [Mycena sp. CBHHK59/15]